MIAFVNFEEVKVTDLDHRYVFKGWEIHRACEELCFAKDYVSQLIPKTKTTVVQRWNMMCDMVKSAPDLIKFIRSLGTTQHLGRIVLPGGAPHDSALEGARVNQGFYPKHLWYMFDLAKAFVENMSHYMGYANQFYIGRNMAVHGSFSERYLLRYMYQGVKRCDWIINWRTLESTTAFYEIGKKLRQYFSEGKIVKVEIPVKVRVTKIENLSDLKIEEPIRILSDATIQIGPISCPYIPGDIFVNEMGGQWIFIGEPNAVVEHWPILDIDSSSMTTWHKVMTTLDKAWQIFDPTKIIFVSTLSV